MWFSIYIYKSIAEMCHHFALKNVKAIVFFAESPRAHIYNKVWHYMM